MITKNCSNCIFFIRSGKTNDGYCENRDSKRFSYKRKKEGFELKPVSAYDSCQNFKNNLWQMQVIEMQLKLFIRYDGQYILHSVYFIYNHQID